MLKLAADENIESAVVRGLVRLDIVRIQDVGLSGATDPDVLQWAAQAGRVLVSHDRRTLRTFAYERILAGKFMPGLALFTTRLPLGVAIDELRLFAMASTEGEWEGQVVFLPLR